MKIKHTLLWIGATYISLCMLGLAAFGGYMFYMELSDNGSGLLTLWMTAGLFTVMGLVVGIGIWPLIKWTINEELAQAKSEACSSELPT